MPWNEVLPHIVANLTVGVLIGLGGFVIWRLQAIFKRRFEIGEEALLVFAEAEKELRQIRSPFYFAPANSAATAPPDFQMYPDEWHRLNEVTTAIRASKEVRSKLPKVQRLARTHLGKEAEASLIAIETVFTRVGYATMQQLALIRDPANDLNFAANHKKWETIIYHNVNDDFTAADVSDLTSQRIINARDTLQGICSKYHSINLVQVVTRKVLFVMLITGLIVGGTVLAFTHGG